MPTPSLGRAGPGRVDIRRGGHRQIAHFGLARRANRGSAAYPATLPMLALSSRQPALPLRAAIRARGGHHGARRPRGEARKTGKVACARDRPARRGRAADRGDAVDPYGSALSRAQSFARAAAPPDPVRIARSDGGAGEKATGPDAVRGRALGRRDLAGGARSRYRAHAQAARAVAGDVPPGVRGAVARAARRRRHRARAPGARRGRSRSSRR